MIVGNFLNLHSQNLNPLSQMLSPQSSRKSTIIRAKLVKNSKNSVKKDLKLTFLEFEVWALFIKPILRCYHDNGL